MKIKKIPANVLEDLHKRGFSYSAIKKMSPEHAFDEYLKWNGIIGYGASLIRALDGLRAANE